VADRARRSKQWLVNTHEKADGPTIGKGGNVTHNYWKNSDNQKKFMDFIKNQIGGTYDDLYKATNNLILANGGIKKKQPLFCSHFQNNTSRLGRRLLSYYRNSTPEAVIAIYPEHDWQRFKFSRLPSTGFWPTIVADLRKELELDSTAYFKSPSYRTFKNFFDTIATANQFTTLDKWYHIKKSQSSKLAFTLKLMGLSLPSALALAYPNHQWDPKLFSASLATTVNPKVQRQLHSLLSNLLPENQKAVLEYKYTML